MPIAIRVLYFAAARDITHVESDNLTLIDDDALLSSLTRLLVSKYGNRLQAILDQAMYAVNMEYVAKEDEAKAVLKDKDEVAIIPPVSGG